MKTYQKMLLVGGIGALAACNKPNGNEITEEPCNDPRDPECENYDPNLQRCDDARVAYAAAQADSIQATNDARAAAVTARNGISVVFDGGFNTEMSKKTKPYMFADTLAAWKRTVELLREEFGNPTPLNHEELSALYAKTIHWNEVAGTTAAAKTALVNCEK